MSDRLFKFVWLGVLCSLLSSCQQYEADTFVETESKEYVAAKQKIREGNSEAALAMYLQVIDKYSHAPESHLEAGVIYLQEEDEPLLAIYHFDRYLEQKPSSRETPLVQELILSAKKRFAANLPANPFKQAVSRMELLETIAGLKRKIEEQNQVNLALSNENTRLKQQLSGTHDTMREILSPNASDDEELYTESAPGGVRRQELVVRESTREIVERIAPETTTENSIPDTYEVKPGDSLYAISMNIYGDATHIQSIFQANRDQLRSVNDLRPGQVLKMPKL